MADDATRDALRTRLLGWSAACPLIEPADIGRDLALATDPATGLVDLARVEQVDALGQSLSLALTTLTSLYLGGTKVTDTGVKELVPLRNLTGLTLGGTQVTDAGAKELAALTNLTLLDLVGTKVTDAGVKELKKALPKCLITK